MKTSKEGSVGPSTGDEVGNDGLTDTERQQHADNWKRGVGLPFSPAEMAFIREWASQRRTQQQEEEQCTSQVTS